MEAFPMFIDIAQQPILIVGGGQIALNKANRLLPFHPRLRVVAPEILPELARLAELSLRPFAPADVEGCKFVVAATDHREINRTVAEACRLRHIPVNVVDDPALCDFFFPALVKRGRLVVGISTSGASPAAAAWLRSRLDAALPQELDALIEETARRREELMQLPCAERTRLLRQFIEEKWKDQ